LVTIDDMWRFANCVLAAHCAPKGMDSKEAITIALQLGAEVGMSPMQSVQNIAVIGGRPVVWGDAMLGLVQASGVLEEFHESFEGTPYDDKYRALCAVKRKGFEQIVRGFSVAQAKRAGIWGKSGPWTSHPDRMLQRKARNWALTDGFADVLKGLQMREDVENLLNVPHAEVIPATDANVPPPSLDKPQRPGRRGVSRPPVEATPPPVERVDPETGEILETPEQQEEIAL
jgi:hypothetical protein